MRMQIESLCGVMVKAPGAFDNPAIAAAADMERASAPIPMEDSANFNFSSLKFWWFFACAFQALVTYSICIKYDIIQNSGKYF